MIRAELALEAGLRRRIPRRAEGEREDP